MIGSRNAIRGLSTSHFDRVLIPGRRGHEAGGTIRRSPPSVLASRSRRPLARCKHKRKRLSSGCGARARRRLGRRSTAERGRSSVNAIHRESLRRDFRVLTGGHAADGARGRTCRSHARERPAAAAGGRATPSVSRRAGRGWRRAGARTCGRYVVVLRIEHDVEDQLAVGVHATGLRGRVGLTGRQQRHHDRAVGARGRRVDVRPGRAGRQGDVRDLQREADRSCPGFSRSSAKPEPSGSPTPQTPAAVHSSDPDSVVDSGRPPSAANAVPTARIETTPPQPSALRTVRRMAPPRSTLSTLPVAPAPRNRQRVWPSAATPSPLLLGGMRSTSRWPRCRDCPGAKRPWSSGMS